MSAQHPLKPPLRHALVFEWSFGEARSLDEVVERLKKSGFYVLRPRKDAIAFTSQNKPSIVVFWMLQTSDEGGILLLAQTHLGHYRWEQVVNYMHVLGLLAGVEFEPAYEEPPHLAEEPKG